jgi:acyl carrier protein
VDHDEILSSINELMRDIFNEEDLVATDEMTADDVDDWDSHNHVRLMVAIQERFNIEFNGKEVNAPENVGELVEIVASKLKSR